MDHTLRGLGAFLFERVEGREINEILHIEIERGAPLDDVDWHFHFPSLTRDPGRSDVLYLAADQGRQEAAAKLLVFSRSSEGSGNTVACEVRPFGPADRAAIREFAEKIDTRFLPRPQRDQPAVATGNRHPEISLPAAFAAFGRILGQTGVNMASTVQLSATREMTTDEAIAARSGDSPTEVGHTRVSIEHLYHCGLWAAIRAGWRHGYTAEADHFIISGHSEAEIAASIEATREAIRRAAGYTKFTTDSSRMFRLEADQRHPAAWRDAEVDAQFVKSLSPDEQRWVFHEFGHPIAIDGYRYEFEPAEIRRLAAKFGESLKLNEQLYDFIREQKRGAEFDFEPSIDEAETLTTPKELLFYMHWLAARGRPASLVPPNLGFKKRQAYPETLAALTEYAHHKMWPELVPQVEREYAGRPVEELGARVKELAAVARHFNGTLSIHSGSGKQARVLEMIGQATGGRVNYKISGELQLQLLDVLAEQPAGSRWRKLYERMADGCAEFAARNAFGGESGLAEEYRRRGLPYSLGDRNKGRVDGNLFLVFWIGNMVGSRDVEDPEGDRRFFKEKIEELPAELVAEVRRRNADYIVWLARHLRG
jgi:tagaturonate epimerase